MVNVLKTMIFCRTNVSTIMLVVGSLDFESLPLMPLFDPTELDLTKIIGHEPVPYREYFPNFVQTYRITNVVFLAVKGDFSSMSLRLFDLHPAWNWIPQLLELDDTSASFDKVKYHH